MVYDESDDQLAIEFLKKFGELEFLVKRLGYRFEQKNKTVTGTDFKKWIQGTNPKVDEKIALKIIELAPKVLVVEAVGLGFTDRKVQGDNINEMAMEYVKRVRNNLYHGEKQVSCRVEKKLMLQEQKILLRQVLPF